MEKLRTSDDTLDLGFSEREQAAIIACAAELQREAGLTATLSDLECAALEAGIEPRFIREAVRLQSAKPETAEIVPTDDSSWPIWRAAIVAAILVPAEVPVIAWDNNLLLSLWGSIVIAALFALGLPRRSSFRWIAVAWPMFAVFSIMVFDNTSRFQHRWALDVLFAATQGAVALSVCMLASTRRRRGFRATSFGRQGEAAEK
jgi:hypothetical protein